MTLSKFHSFQIIRKERFYAEAERSVAYACRCRVPFYFRVSIRCGHLLEASAIRSSIVD